MKSNIQKSKNSYEKLKADLLLSAKNIRANYLDAIFTLSEIKENKYYILDGFNNLKDFLIFYKLPEKMEMHISTVYQKISLFNFLKNKNIDKTKVKKATIKYIVDRELQDKVIDDDLYLGLKDIKKKYPTRQKFRKKFSFPISRTKNIFLLKIIIFLASKLRIKKLATIYLNN